MKTLITTAAAGLVFGTAALASGPIAPPPYVAPVTVAPVASYDWSGAYAGAGVTYGRMGMDTNGAVPSYPDADGFGGSVIAGYNWQNGNMVYGGEVALDFSGRDGSNDCGIGGGANCGSAADHQASIRGRVGYAMDQSLMFMTVGYGSDSRSVNGAFGGDGARFSGAMLGVGYERMVNNDWSVRGDLEHYFYGEETLNGVATDGDSSLLRMSLIRRF